MTTDTTTAALCAHVDTLRARFDHLASENARLRRRATIGLLLAVVSLVTPFVLFVIARGAMRDLNVNSLTVGPRDNPGISLEASSERAMIVLVSSGHSVSVEAGRHNASVGVHAPDAFAQIHALRGQAHVDASAFLEQPHRTSSFRAVAIQDQANLNVTTDGVETSVDIHAASGQSNVTTRARDGNYATLGASPAAGIVEIRGGGGNGPRVSAHAGEKEASLRVKGDALHEISAVAGDATQLGMHKGKDTSWYADAEGRSAESKKGP